MAVMHTERSVCNMKGVLEFYMKTHIKRLL